ncbi:hypothetical protein [Erythrobacter sp.]|jgi:hypothetical protein|uniref:hypothetical protein n=1 Tax=Erythrobacter sp. TaxID=1042 RepID=UPI002EAAB793|nr:hypothetical protein [Erythrobacter sp.]
MKKLILPLFALASLSACDVATDMAGDAIAGELRTQFLAQCEGVAENLGIASENVTPACECSADDFANDLSDGELQIDRARIEQVLRSCVAGEPGATEATDAPMETSNG